MTTDELITKLEPLISNVTDRMTSLQIVANLLREIGDYRWVGLYDVDRKAGLVRNLVWSGPSVPAHRTFPITAGLTGAAISSGKTINVGNVAADPRYLTALGSTQSEIIVPVFDAARKNVVGTIDVENRHNVQSLLETFSRIIRPLWDPID
jgi:putative methionine-R-sulfoxide reductase with GAF domain